MPRYTRLSLEEREEVSLGLLAGLSLRAMAVRLGRAASTLSREVRRNSAGAWGYRAVRAQRYARERRARCGCRRLDRPAGLRRWVFGRLRCYWSPQQIARELKRRFSHEREMRLSHEALYTYLYVLPRGALKQELLACLRQHRKRRRPRSRGEDRVPQEVRFETKGAIALAQIEQALADGVPQGVVLADAAYGTDSKFRQRLTELELRYAVGIVSTTSVWPEGKEPLAPKPSAGRGRRTKLLRRDAKHKPVSVKALAASLAQQQWRHVTWRAGADGELCSRFARVRPAHHDYWRAQPWPEQWLLIEWPSGAPEPTKYWLSTLGDNISLTELVRIAKLRWRIERDYQELKQELGLGHFEGRGWRGFHHHATLCIAAYGFLVAQRAQTEARSKKNRSAWLKAPALPANFRPRGSPEPRPTP